MAPNSRSPSLPAKLARSVLTKNLKVEKGERVMIEGWTHTLPWAVAMARECRRLGARPMIVYEDEDAYWDAVESGESAIIGKPGKHEWAALERSDVYVYFWGPGDRLRLANLPDATREKLTAYNGRWYDVAFKAGLRGVRMEVARPYPSLAKVYGVPEEAWRRDVVNASLVDPESLHKIGKKVAKKLETGKRLTISHPNGTELALRLAGRPARINWGVVEESRRKQRFGGMVAIPSGSVYVALDERHADGKLVANRPSFYDNGAATGGEFKFRDGVLGRYSFATNEKLFTDGYATGGEGRDMPGLFSIGLNPELHATPQLEDAERGAALVSVGGNQGFGGKNGSAFFGWTVVAGADISVDGTPLLDGGRIV